jgi:hypothetical protein
MLFIKMPALNAASRTVVPFSTETVNDFGRKVTECFIERIKSVYAYLIIVICAKALTGQSSGRTASIFRNSRTLLGDIEARQLSIPLAVLYTSVSNQFSNQFLKMRV